MTGRDTREVGRVESDQRDSETWKGHSGSRGMR